MSEGRIVIAGGGITGLTIAYRLLASRAGSDSRPDVVVLEARPVVGGNIRTERTAGLVIDGGPDSFVATKPQATALCKELGLGDRLIETRAENRRVYVGLKGRLRNLPEGIMLTVPTRWVPVMGSPLLSLRGKLRMAIEPFIRPRTSTDDESLGSFVERRLGKEALDRIGEPLLGGIYAGDIHALSARSTFPQLVDFEARHGSLVRGAVAAMASRKKPAGKVPASAFLSLLGGMGELIAALEDRVQKLGGQIRRNTRLVRVERPEAGADGHRFVALVEHEGAQERIVAAQIILATPAYVAADALAELAPDVATTLRDIPYVSTGTVALAYPRVDVPHALDASGVIFPKSEGRKILATTFVSSKWPGRAPSDTALLRVFVGGHRHGADLKRSDEELVQTAREELNAILGLQSAPSFTRVFRYERSNPQPTVGHQDRLDRLAQARLDLPGLHFAGAPYEGVGIPDCVRQANDTADRILALAH